MQLSCLLLMVIPAIAKSADTLRFQLPSGSWAGAFVPHAGKARMPVVVWLHGGMGSSRCDKGTEAYQGAMRILDGKALIASPSACADRDWLTPQGLTAIDETIEWALAHGGDSTRIILAGVSDGGLGVVHHALRGKHIVTRRVMLSTWVGSVLPVQALPQATPALARSQWIFLQGGADRLYPETYTQPYLQNWQSAIPRTEILWEPTGEHDFSWWEQYRSHLLRKAFTLPESRTH